MNGKTQIKLGGKQMSLWFNNFAKVELGKMLLPSKNGFPAKPEELQLLDAISKMSKENHLILLSKIIYAGLIGDIYAKDKDPGFERSDITMMVAEADQDELYNCWVVFLDAMGMNLDKIKKAVEVNETIKKKVK